MRPTCFPNSVWPFLPRAIVTSRAALERKAQPNTNGACLVWWGNTNGSVYGGAFDILNNAPLFGVGPYSWQGGGEGGGNGVDSGVAVDTNWHYVVVVYDGTTMSIWLDGTNRGADSTSINTPLCSLLIGASEDGDNGAYQEFFAGIISDVRIYNRALSTQEITALNAAELSSVTPRILLLPTITIGGTIGMSYDILYTTKGEVNYYDFPCCKCAHAASSSGRFQSSANAASLKSAASCTCGSSSRMVTKARLGQLTRTGSTSRTSPLGWMIASTVLISMKSLTHRQPFVEHDAPSGGGRQTFAALFDKGHGLLAQNRGILLQKPLCQANGALANPHNGSNLQFMRFFKGCFWPKN